MNRGCSSSSQLESKKEECGLLSLPDDVALDCLSKVSRLDLLALATVSRSHRFVAEDPDLRDMRIGLGKLEPYLYVFMHMYPEDPSPRWFVLHPLQHRLKPVHTSFSLSPAPLSGSCFVTTDWGIYCIGGLMNGKPTSEVRFFNAIDHFGYQAPPMKMARSGASASLINKKIYVFGGCWDVADSSNWLEVYDFKTCSWEFLFVFTPKMPLNIQQSVVIQQGKVFHGVDEDGQIFHFTPTSTTSPPTPMLLFSTNGIVEPNPENRNDWLLFEVLLCRGGIGGRLLWRWPDGILWKEVQGLEELLQQQHIIKICSFSERTIAIFWEAPPQQDDGLFELWFAEISMKRYRENEGLWEVCANIESSALVYSSHSSFNLLYAASVFA